MIWGLTAAIAPGAGFWYRLTMTNTGPGVIYDIGEVDLLPKNSAPSDWKIMFRGTPARGSQFSVSGATLPTYSTIPTFPPVFGVAGTRGGANLNLINSLGVNLLGTLVDSWPYTTGMSYGNNLGIAYSGALGFKYGLVKNGSVSATFKVTAAATAKAMEKVCNEFAAGGFGKYITNGALAYTQLTPAASNIACATVIDCCENTTLKLINGQCCLRLATGCPIAKFKVTVNGPGRIGPVTSSTCGVVPSPVGLTTWTYTPSCPLTNMDMCFTSTNPSASFTVTFVLTFSNGETCTRVSQPLHCN